ncbi:MAG: outer membrane beta-barrel protein [Pseudomonadota bacterium]
MRLFIILISMMVGFTLPAHAQIIRDNDVLSIKTRTAMDPDGQPLGIRAGTFLFHPYISAGTEYDDNIFRTNTNTEQDIIYILNPRLEIKSDWNLHELRFETDANFGIYQNNENEAYEDYIAELSARYDIAYNTYLFSELSYRRLHEDRGSPDDVRGDEPTEYNLYHGELSFTRALGKIKFFVAGLIQKYEFEDARSNGTVIDNSVRDRQENEIQTRIGYAFRPNYEIYARAHYTDIEYDQTSIFDRSSDEYDLRIGTDLKLSRKLKANIYGGYITRDYEGQFAGLDDFNYGADLIWNLTDITSLEAYVDREVFETTSVTGTLFSGYLKTSTGFNISHAFRRNIIGEFHLDYENDDYIGGGSTSREDDIYRVGTDLDIGINRNASLSLEYDYIERDSNIQTANFTNNVVGLTFRVKF